MEVFRWHIYEGEVMQTIQVEELTDLFTIIKNKVNESNIPEKKKKGLIKMMSSFAKTGYDLGATGKTTIEVSE